MPLSVSELDEAKNSVTALLEALSLEAYLFEVEPRQERWEVCIECATDEGWMSVTLEVAASQLEQSRQNPVIRDQLLKEWGAHLTACKRSS